MSKILKSAVLLSAAVAVQAVQVTYDLSVSVDGNLPNGTAPYITATFDDVVSPGFVRLTMTSPNLVGDEFVDEWQFNFNPAKNLANLSFTAINPVHTAAQESGSPDVGADAFQLNGPSGDFDILFDFENSNSGGGAARFKTGETIVFDIAITGGGLTANDFNFGNNNGKYSGAHIQGIDSQAGSAKIVDGDGPRPPEGTPTPDGGATAALLGLGLLGMAAVRRK